MIKEINKAFWNVIIRKDERRFYWYATTFDKKVGVEYLIGNKSFSNRQDALNNWKEFCEVNKIKERNYYVSRIK